MEALRSASRLRRVRNEHEDSNHENERRRNEVPNGVRKLRARDGKCTLVKAL
jgi:hypothetical protein